MPDNVERGGISNFLNAVEVGFLRLFFLTLPGRTKLSGLPKDKMGHTHTAQTHLFHHSIVLALSWRRLIRQKSYSNELINLIFWLHKRTPNSHVIIVVHDNHNESFFKMMQFKWIDLCIYSTSAY